jgi:hypothetical protein
MEQPMNNKRQYLASLSPSENQRLAILISEVIGALTKSNGCLPDAVADWIASQSDDWFVSFVESAMRVPESQAIALPVVADIRKALSKPHMLILGETGSGKSTLVKFLVASASCPSIVLDPHAAPDDWQGMKVIGAGRKYQDIGDEVSRLVALMDVRYDERSNGQKQFIPLLVIIDEFPAIASTLGKAFTEQIMLLVRESRKVAIKLVILSQGAEVKTLGIDGQGSIRECFAIVAIGKFATARAKSLNDDAIKSMLAASKYPAMLDDLPCALPEIDRLTLPRLPLPPDYLSLLTVSHVDSLKPSFSSVDNLSTLVNSSTCQQLSTALSTILDYAKKQNGYLSARTVKQNIRLFRDESTAQIRAYFQELSDKNYGTAKGGNDNLEFILY